MLKFLNMLASCLEYVMVDIDKDIGVRTTTAVLKLLVFSFSSWRPWPLAKSIELQTS